MPAYSQMARADQELRASDVAEDGDDFDEAAGEDGMGVIAGAGGWDEEVLDEDEEEGLDEEIEDWD
jgi:hypothetical protein